VVADHRVILAMSLETLVEEEHGGRSHDGRICLVAQAVGGDEPGLLRAMVKELRR